METKLLDHGYTKHIESWGSDEAIIEAARMSTSKGFLGWGPKPCPHCSAGELVWGRGCNKCENTGRVLGDEKLLRYLYEHRHATPFEMAGMTIEIQAPIFVFREWHRHRTQSYNEMSGRYVELPELSYVPSRERLEHGFQATKNKQSSEYQPLTDEMYLILKHEFEDNYRDSWARYQRLLKAGISRELACRVLPTTQYSRMRASANLRNWLAFLTLRMDTAAQWEIRQYANAVGDFIAQTFPRTWELFAENGQNHRS